MLNNLQGNYTDYVEEAHQKIKNLKNKNDLNVTVRQLRKILNYANLINNKLLTLEVKGEIKDKLPEELKNELRSLKILIIYQSSRKENKSTSSRKENISSVKKFVDETGLLKKLDDIEDDVNKLKNYFKYLEALVAYHKFEGGKD